MLQQQIVNITYADMRKNKSKAGDLFVIQVDKPRLDNVPRLQPIEVEVETNEEKKWSAKYCDRIIERCYFTFMIFCILLIIVGVFYLYTTAAVAITVVVVIALFINRSIRRRHNNNT